jgi:hypothetical protein
MPASGGELGTALAPPRSEDHTPCPGTHAQPEAVRLGAAPVVRLEGPLAHQKLQSRRATDGEGSVRRRPTRGRSMDDPRTPTAIGRPRRARARDSSRRQASSRYGDDGVRVKPGRPCREVDRRSCLDAAHGRRGADRLWIGSPPAVPDTWATGYCPLLLIKAPAGTRRVVGTTTGTPLDRTVNTWGALRKGAASGG